MMSKNKLQEFLQKNFQLDERINSFNQRKIHTLEIVITEKCNLSCFYCYETKSIKQMSFEKAKQIIDEAKDYGIKQIGWLGGETTLNKDWISILEYSKEKDFRNELWTNGTTIQNNIQNFMELCDILILHVDTINPYLYKQIQGGDINKLLNDFNNLIKKYDPNKIRLNITLTKQNFDSLEETMSYFLDKDIQTITLIPMYKIGKGKKLNDKEFLSKEELYEAFLLRSKLEKSELIFLGPSEYTKWYQMTNAHIHVNGDVHIYPGHPTNVGNIFKICLKKILETSFDELSFSRYVSKDGFKNLIEGYCGICENSKYCFGTRVNYFFIHDTLNKTDPYCLK